MIRWQQVYGVEPRPLDEITEGGPTYDSDELDGLEIVSASSADSDCTVAHLGDEAILVDPAGGPCAYTVPAGYIYHQPYDGSTWEAVDSAAAIEWADARDLDTGEEYLQATHGEHTARVWQDGGEWFVSIALPGEEVEAWSAGYLKKAAAQEAAEAFLLR